MIPTLREAEPFGQLCNTRHTVEVCGMGEVCADFLDRYFERFHPKEVVMVGSAGAYSEGGLNVFDMVGVSGECRNDSSVVRPDYPLHTPFTEVLSRTVAAAESFRPDGSTAAIENMEGALFFEACNRHSVHSAQIRVVSNYVGAPRSEWYIDRAMRRLAEYMASLDSLL